MADVDIDYARQHEIDCILEGEHQHTISMQMIPEAAGYGFLDDDWDADGDSIVVRQESRFLLEGSASVTAEFAHGTSPKMAARALRKFADMLDGPKGYPIVNLGRTDADFTNAQRLADGDVFLYNFPALLREHNENRESGYDERDDEDEPAEDE